MKDISISKAFSVLKWIGFFIVAALMFFFGYEIYSWIASKFALTIPTQASKGKTIVQTQQDYLAQQVAPPPADNQNSTWYDGVKDLATTDNLTWTDKLYLYLQTLNPFSSTSTFNSGK